MAIYTQTKFVVDGMTPENIVGGNTETDVLVADYSVHSNLYPNGIHLGYLGNHDIRDRLTGLPILTFSNIEAFVVTGTQSNDVLSGGAYDDVFSGSGGNDQLYGNAGNDYLSGGDGNDYLEGGAGADTLLGGKGSDTLVGGAGDILNGQANEPFNVGPDTFIVTEAAEVIGDANDKLIADYSQGNYGGGIHFGLKAANPGADSRLHVSNSNGTTLLTFSQLILNYDITGTQFNDIFDTSLGQTARYNGGAGDDKLNGGSGNDVLIGGDGADTLNDGAGNDVLSGGAGNDQIHATFGSDTVYAGAGNDVIYAVAGVDGVSKQLSGGEGNDRFILDVTGSVTQSFSFNTTTLANFVNAITLPDNPTPDWQKIGIDMAFDATSAVLGGLPVAGSALGFLASVGKTGYDTYAEQQAIKDAIILQNSKAQLAASTYNNSQWGTITSQGKRDLITINDFEIGKDTILLPKLTDSTQIFKTSFATMGGKDGLLISIKGNDNVEKNVAFIVNNYHVAGIDTTKFAETINDLFLGGQVGKFTTTPVKGSTAGTVLDINNSHVSFANDRIYADGGVFDGDGNFDVGNVAGGNDTAYGYYGDDVIDGGAGNDTLYGGTGFDTGLTSIFEQSYGNDGNDYLVGGNGNDTLYGESGDDYLNGDVKNTDGTFQFAGNDKLYGGVGNDKLEAGNGIDILYGEDGNDFLDSGAGGDYLSGGAGDDYLSGGAGNDTLNGGAGFDGLNGGLGDDILVDNAGKVSGGAGIDTLQADYSLLGYNGAGIHLGFNGETTIRERFSGTVVLSFDTIEKLSVTGTQFSDVLIGRASTDSLTGGAGNDTLNGAAGDDILNGDAGNDGVIGGAGIDYLDGGIGNDTLSGGLGNDYLTGGLGVDKFLFNAALGATNNDTIGGYSVADDTIVLENAIFTQFANTGAIAANNFVKGAGAVALDAYDFLVYNTANGALSYDADGSGAGAAVQFATLVGVPALTSADFLIV
ncbi:MAG: calcium-binding protein [Methyloglobulus sp.]